MCQWLDVSRTQRLGRILFRNFRRVAGGLGALACFCSPSSPSQLAADGPADPSVGESSGQRFSSLGSWHCYSLILHPRVIVLIFE